MKTCCVISVLVALLHVATAGRFADSLKKCGPTDKLSLNRCLRQVVEEMRPFLKTGIPTLNLQPLEPMYINNVEFIDTEGGKNIRANFTDILVYGMSKFQVKSIEIDPSRLTLDTELDFPSLYMNGSYNMDGAIQIVFSLKLQGTGKFWTSLNQVKAFGFNQLELLTKGGEDYLQVKSTSIDFNAQDISLHLFNLFGGKPGIGDVINEVLNENADELLNQMKPKLGGILNNMVKDVLNDALSELPITNIGIYRNQN